MQCPYSDHELEWHDWYGNHMKLNGSGNKIGDIYLCQEENCEAYEQHFYTRNGELNEGYPC